MTPLIKSIVSDFHFGGVAPVSYTHLDVYKRQAQHGEIVVALIDDEATVKRLSLKSGQVWLLPENEAYSPIDGTYAQILGKVAAVVRRY